MELLPAMGKLPSGERLERIRQSPHYGKDGFENEIPTMLMREGASMPRMLWEFMNKPRNTRPPGVLPSIRTDLRVIAADGGEMPVIVWFGHSSYFIKTGGMTVLVDPVFCGHASPFSWSTRAFAGADVYGVDDMPDIDVLVITHDHYDHLDYKTVQRLAPKVRHIYTSLGVGAHLEYWGIAASKITELDWWEGVAVGSGGMLTATPARHFSGRGLRRGRTFWSSFVLQAGGYTLCLGGDSGYGPHFNVIRERFGAMDLAILECGQYGKDWPDIHMLPEETAKAAEDLGAGVLLPVHWGKFSLSLHPWDEPIRRVTAATRERGLTFTTPLIGEPVVLGGALPQTAWWEGVMRLLLFVFFFGISQAFAQDLTLNNLRCGGRINPLGIDNAVPKLSWEIGSGGRGVLQTAYRVLVAEDSVSLEKNAGTVWDSRKVFSDASIQVPYRGHALLPARRYYWKVMVWDNHGDSSRWSGAAMWQTGLFTKADWKGAKWIGYEDIADSNRQLPGSAEKGDGPSRDTLPLLRKEFVVRKPLKRATAFICGLGHFEMQLNGAKVGDHFLDPGWTRYDKEALYVPFDITSNVHEGINAVGVMLGNGFYYIPGQRYRKLTVAFGYPKMIARIYLEYADGTTGDVVSDESWKASAGPIIFSSEYGGEDYDARRQQEGWDKPGFDEKGWKAAVKVDGPPMLHSQQEEPVKWVKAFLPNRKVKLSAGVWVFDLGQNMSGVPMLTTRGAAGKTIRIIPGELLKGDTVDQSATGTPCYFDYTLKGGNEEKWSPAFMYYGFRYLQVEGAVPAGEPNPDGLPVIVGVAGWHTRSALDQDGRFSCSSELFRRTDTLIQWAMRSNTASVFTDCPHREKLGWLEEAHLMGSSLRYNYNISNTYRKIVHDMMGAQTREGLVPEIAPEFTQFSEPFRDSPEWGSSCIIVPWYCYQYYGDKETLEKSYSMMRRYNAYLITKAQHNILYQGLGDWYDLGPGDPGESQLTPKGLTATAIWYYDLSILVKTARLLGKAEDAKGYEALAAAVKKAFNEKFFNKATRQYGTGSQTANAMPVFAGLVAPADKAAVVENIVKDLRSRNNALTSGDIGFRYLLKVLADEGRSDVIFDMNSRRDVPGYGYQLAHGATALTESWAALPYVSNNHFMLGHIMEWFYTGLAGIRAEDGAVGFREIALYPELVGDITWVNGDYHSPYGMISSHWKKEGKLFSWSISIPVNAKATIYLPVSPGDVVIEGGKALKGRKDLVLLRTENGRMVLRAGSGNYEFRVAGRLN